VAYSIAKYGMSLCVLGMAEEFRPFGIAVNALWPHTPIATAAIEFATRSRSDFGNCRTPAIMADAAYAVLAKPSREFTGQFLIDDLLLAREGVADFAKYKHSDAGTLTMDLFVDERTPVPPGVTIAPRPFG
jgi:citronellol/citronellal dehydrogenase